MRKYMYDEYEETTWTQEEIEQFEYETNRLGYYFLSSLDFL